MTAGRYSNREIAAGAFLLLLMAGAASALIAWSRSSALLRERQEIRVAFADVGALRPESPVRFNGVEVGRVKWMRPLHLDAASVARLPRLARRDVYNLPVRSEEALKELKKSSDALLDKRCREAIEGQTMIELSLEVLKEEQRQYRVDDQVRVVSTVFGDAAVEIVSGTGALRDRATHETALVLGDSGDFRINMERSMGEVKEILADVTHIVGTEERKNFKAGSERFDALKEKFAALGKRAEERGKQAGQRLDRALETASSAQKRLDGAAEALKPEAQRISDSAGERASDMKKRLAEVQTESEDLLKFVQEKTKALREEAGSTLDRAKPHYDGMNENLRGVYERAGALSFRFDCMSDTLGQAVVQSEPEFPRIKRAAAASAVNLEQFAEAAKMNKDLFIGNGDKGEHEYNTALSAYRHITRATRHIREAGADLGSLADELKRNPPWPRENLNIETEDSGAGPPGTGSSSSQPGSDAPDLAQLLARCQQTLKGIHSLQRPLDEVLNAIDDRMLPEFTRKRAGWRGRGE